MADQHSRLPWRAIEGDIFDAVGEIATVFGNHLPYTMDVGNAAFIVRACNAHYKMLEALKVAQSALAMLTDETAIKGSSTAQAWASAVEAEFKARAAIAAVEAEAR